MSNEIDKEFLRQEYFHLQDTVESFDEKSLTIKAWSVTLSMAGIGAAFTARIELLLLLSASASLLFWLIDTSWKTFQQANYHRLRTIEKYMKGKIPDEDFRVPDITGAWSVGWRQTSFLKIMFWHHVFLPHALVVIAGVSLWLINLYYPIVPIIKT